MGTKPVHHVVPATLAGKRDGLALPPPSGFLIVVDTDSNCRQIQNLGIALIFLFIVGETVYLADKYKRDQVKIPDSIRGIGEADHESAITRFRTFMDNEYFSSLGACHAVSMVILRLYVANLRLRALPGKFDTLEDAWRADLNLLEDFLMRN